MPKRTRAVIASKDSSMTRASKRPASADPVPLQWPVPSGECAHDACACQSPPLAVDAALKRVRNAKAYCGSMPSRGPLNEELVLRAICDDYISHSRRAEDLKPKQVRLREALRRVAVKLKMPFLSIFNCKTTSLRTLGRALWEGCSMPPEPKHKAQELVQTQKEDCALVDSIFEHLATQYGEAAVTPEPALPLPLDESTRRTLQRELESDGIVLLSGFVPEDTCKWLLREACEHRRKYSPTWLTETMSLGRRGCYFEKNWSLATLRHIQEKVVESLGLDATGVGAAQPQLPATNNKAVLLAYTEAGENWAHQVRAWKDAVSPGTRCACSLLGRRDGTRLRGGGGCYL